MQVNGEAYFFINVWMNFLSLYLAGTLCRLRIRQGRCLVSALLGGLYALLAWEIPFLRQLPFLCLIAFFMVLLAFPRDFLRPFPMLFFSAFLLSGISGYLMENSVSCLWILFFSAVFSLWISRIFRRGMIRPRNGLRLLICHHGKSVSIPAFRDSGNLLSEPITGLPVIVAPHSRLAHILPQSIRPQDLSTLPVGWRLISIETAGGKKTLMAFHPDRLQLQGKNALHSLDALIALSDFAEKRALLPEAIFHQEEEKNASL